MKFGCLFVETLNTRKLRSKTKAGTTKLLNGIDFEDRPTKKAKTQEPGINYFMGSNDIESDLKKVQQDWAKQVREFISKEGKSCRHGYG